jgi:hypothetical protein
MGCCSEFRELSVSLCVHQEILVPLAAAKRRLEATRSLPPLPGRGGGTRSNDDDLKCCSAYGYGAGDQQLVSSRPLIAPARAAAGTYCTRYVLTSLQN